MKKIFKCSQYIFIITVIVNCSFFLTACVNNENLQFNPKVSDFSSSNNTLSQGTESEQSEQTGTKVTDFADLDEKNPAYIHVFAAEDVIVEPQITEYDFEYAYNTGDVQEIYGMLPGTSEGTWYIIVIEGIEYYFGKYDFQEPKDTCLFGYSIISNQYVLSNGLSVGMTADDILKLYPNMAVMDFEGNDMYQKVTGHQGWNPVSYPRSYVGMDDDWEYNEKIYYWENQFDYVMIGDIDSGTVDSLPVYIGLFIKDNIVTAITFFHPTAN